MRVHDSLKTPGISYHQVFLETLFETHICDYLPNLDASDVKINLHELNCSRTVRGPSVLIHWRKHA